MFALVAKIDSIRLALSIAASKQWEAHHIDVKYTFLNEDISEDIYMNKNQGFVSDQGRSTSFGHTLKAWL